jgi:peptidoglycan-associated lipoprotein
MLKKITILATVLILSACQTKSEQDDFKIDEGSVEGSPETYQTIDSEKQAAELNAQTQAEVKEIEVQDRIFFAYDAYDVSDDSKKILDTQVAWLKSDPTIKITVEGHCDERGTREYNIALGERRANAVKTYLTANGIDGSRIKTVSYGKERPAFFGNSEEIYAKNRRAVTLVN